ncbi:glycogen synthase GlgA [Thiomicrorhabdus sp. zzn3]|uniref:glycogen synthase GlgA n=1 Tax=Thiomicrorhabdus sp. zzn3 TaxID=3039775 RepID=UPI002436F6B7|nr:glycogen synthase GlgA [Thiomicrorhabdus sp. zzn3]MDG6777353.1 glycogen synthase GlgA [Thiomicrorhabdus sp. zzn3]
MKILFATSEAHPLIKTGGLGDVSGSLPNALAALKHKVRLVLPAYQAVMKKLPEKSLKKVAAFSVSGCGRSFNARVLQLKAGAFDDIQVPVWLIDIPELFDRPGNPYLAEDGHDWWDNGERFGVFSKVVAELAMDRCGLKWQPDVVHVNDWQTGLVSALLSVEPQRPKTVFTVHNMAYPGQFPKSLFDLLELPASLWHMDGVEFWGHFSMLKAGLIKSDWVTTVSPTYAKEICFPEFAYGFEGVLQMRKEQGRLVGILNGIDEHVWSPQHDELIVQNYSVKKGRVSGKLKNKRHLLEELSLVKGLPESEIEQHISSWMKAPLIGLVGRLVEQKGIDLVLQVLPELLDQTDANFVFVGSGNRLYEDALKQFSQNYPYRVWTYVGYSESLAHQVEAGADLFLMPSRFEPCGLNQMYSLAYGTPPIVHHTGGLADTVVNATDENLKQSLATGFVFYDPSRHALKSTLLHALHLFAKPRTWQKIQKTGMQQEFGWKASAKRYVKLYSEEC